MRRKHVRFFSLFAAVIFMLSAVSCGDDNSTYDIQGFQISDIGIVLISDDSYNFTVGINNAFSNDRYFNVRQFRLMLNDSEEIPQLGGETLCNAGKFEKFSFLISPSHPKMEVGDPVTVYYDDNKICEIKIKEL